MRFARANKESALGVRGAIPGSDALLRKGLTEVAQREGTWEQACRVQNSADAAKPWICLRDRVFGTHRLLPVVETQAAWIAAVLTGRLRLPPPEQMRWTIEASRAAHPAALPAREPAQHPLRSARLSTATAVRRAPSMAAGVAHSDCVEGRGTR
jgi:hypothetical protein